MTFEAAKRHLSSHYTAPTIQSVNEHNIKAGIILTAVGSLSSALLRMPGAKETKVWEEELEIISVVGTLSPDGAHLHLSISDAEGRVFGGHMKNGCTVRTTAEIVIGELQGYLFQRKFDKATGFDELIVKKEN